MKLRHRAIARALLNLFQLTFPAENLNPCVLNRRKSAYAPPLKTLVTHVLMRKVLLCLIVAVGLSYKGEVDRVKVTTKCFLY